MMPASAARPVPWPTPVASGCRTDAPSCRSPSRADPAEAPAASEKVVGDAHRAHGVGAGRPRADFVELFQNGHHRALGFLTTSRSGDKGGAAAVSCVMWLPRANRTPHCRKGSRLSLLLVATANPAATPSPISSGTPRNDHHDPRPLRRASAAVGFIGVSGGTNRGRLFVPRCGTASTAPRP